MNYNFYKQMIAAWVSVCMFVLYLSKSLDEIIVLDFKKKIVAFFVNFSSMKFSEIIVESNIIFIRLFDILYSSKTPKIFRFSIWIIIVVSLFFSYSITPLLQLQKIPIPSIEIILIYSLFFGGILWLIWIIFHYVHNTLIRAIYVFVFVYALHKLMLIYPVQLQFISLLLILLACFIFIFYKIDTKIYQTVSVSIFQISPFRAMLSSFIAIFIISLTKQDVVKIFISDFNQDGLILSSFFILNVIADSISLWETRIILNLANTGSTLRFFIILLLDVIFSVLIFLSIPISTGNLDVFLSAIIFQGNLPWLGILFWSTFFTSIIYWFYLLAIILLNILQKTLKYFFKFDFILPINDKPIYCLGLLFMVPVTLIFIIIALLKNYFYIYS